MVVVMEGRTALPKSPHPSTTIRRMDSFAGERSHRTIIEAIRAANNEEFFEAMESGEPSLWGADFRPPQLSQ